MSKKPDYGKYYIFGMRLHHGKLGKILFAFGFKRLGLILMIDDILDISKWDKMID